MNETADNSAHKSSFERPPLRIAHLFLWTACSGVFLGIVTLAGPPKGFSSAVVSLHSLSAGAGLAGLLLLRRSILRRGRLAPGEKLLQILGAFYLVVIFGVLMDSQLGEDHLPFAVHVLLGVLVFVGIMVSQVFFLVSWLGLLFWTFRETVWHWRLLFFVLFFSPIAALLPLLARSLRSLAEQGLFVSIVGLTIAGSVGVVACFDWRDRTRYPWTHWAGLLCFGWASLTIPIRFVIEWVS